MTISTTVPSSLRRPGSYHEFVFTEAGRGFTPIAFRVALIGTKTSAGTIAVNTPTQVFDEAHAKDLAGVGGELALMARKAFGQARALGAGPEIWIVALDEPGAGTANQTTYTFSGPATISGNYVFSVAGVTMTVGVTSGDSADTVAAAVKSAIDEHASYLPVTATVLTNVVTLTHRTKGENGGLISFTQSSAPTGISAVIATSVAGAGVTDITSALDTLLDKDYRGIAIANTKSADVTDLITHLDDAWSYSQKRYRFAFMGVTDTLGTATTLTLAANDYRIVLGTCEDMPSPPYEVATAMAMAKFSRSRPNANFNKQVLELVAPPSASAYTSTEVESALTSGATPLTPSGDGRVVIERLVTTKTSEGGAPFYDLADIGNAHTSVELATQIDIGYAVGFAQENLTDDVMLRIRDMVISKHRAAEKLNWIRGVDQLLPEILVEEADSPVGRVLVSDPHRVAPALSQGVFKHTMLL